MGCCFSKTEASSAPPAPPFQAAAAAASASVSPVTAVVETSKNNGAIKAAESDPKINVKVAQEAEAKKVKEEESLMKKEVFIIKHRKSHDRDRRASPPKNAADLADGAAASSASTEEMGNNVNITFNGATNNMVRTSSCTKEEVDAILIQCGRLSRSNSSGKAASSGRKYSGSKRSYDFDHQDNENEKDVGSNFESKRKGNDGYLDDDDEAGERRQHRQRHRQSSRPSSSQGRRRTPSREREQQQQQQQRSGSRERGSSSGGGRRVSRSPGRRSENTQANSIGTANVSGNNSASAANRPGKMVSVPATVSSLVMDKSNNGGNACAAEGAANSTIKRISVKRNVGDVGMASSRSAASPRSQSPVRTNPNANVKSCNENQQQPSLSRSSSRKAEQSPYRRNPLSEIDPNSLAYPQATGSKTSAINKGQGVVKESANITNQATLQKPNAEVTNRVVVQGNNHQANSPDGKDNRVAKEQQVIVEEANTQTPMAGNITVTPVVASATENQKPQAVTRSRSARRSRDLDINPETLLNPNPSSYTTLLLEDIQNFHQKNNPPGPSFSLPPCLTKACSILEAVADLNSTTSSNLSCAFSDDRKGLPSDQSSKNVYNFTVGAKAKDPFVESEVFANDDIMEPSFHKYVTVRRGGSTVGSGDMDEQESSGSNSFVSSGQQQHCGFSSSSWEPSSADSIDRWTSRSNTREDDQSPLGVLQRHALSESGRNVNDSRNGLVAKRRVSENHQQKGIGRGRMGAPKGLYTTTIVAAAAST